MKKFIDCKECHQGRFSHYECDQCGKHSYFPEPCLTLDGETLYNFCSIECLRKFVLEEYKKLNSAKNLITGKKEKK